jgi:flagellum-specific ATP synthase
MSDRLRRNLRSYSAQVNRLQSVRAVGTVTNFAGLLIESEGPVIAVGELCEIETDNGLVRAQAIGFRDGKVLSMPLEELSGISIGARIVARPSESDVRVGPELLGRLIDAFGNPIDGKGAIHTTDYASLQAAATGPLERHAITKPIATGVRAIDGFLTCGRGQRIGLFGESGVGKSTLLGAIARASTADVNVIGLIGERNREVGAFLDDVLGDEGLKRSVVVAATSDRPAPVRVRATHLATAVADYFRSQGKHVLLIMDSLTRFAMAQREIGLAAGEPPGRKGYTPSVFQALPKVIERAGNFETGSVTAFYTVLVEGDDLNDPIADAARGLLDGHIVLSRNLAAANHFPAIDVLESISRLANRVASPDHLTSASKLRDAMDAYRRSEDLINLGAYTAGSSARVDSAIRSHDDLEDFLRQDLSAGDTLDNTVEQLVSLAKSL